MNEEHEDILGDDVDHSADELEVTEDVDTEEHKKKKDLLDDETESLADLEDEELDEDDEPFDDIETM